MLEQAAYITLLLKYGKAYVPDYVLHYMDKDYDIDRLYKDEEVLLKMQLSRSSSLKKQESLKKQDSKQSSKSKDVPLLKKKDAE